MECKVRGFAFAYINHGNGKNFQSYRMSMAIIYYLAGYTMILVALVRFPNNIADNPGGRPGS